MSQGSLNQNIRFLRQNVWSFSFNLKDRPNITEYFDGHLGSDVIEKRARRQ